MGKVPDRLVIFQDENDLARRVTCFTTNTNVATISFKPIMVDMLDVVSIPVGDGTIECWMDIQRGKYPNVSFRKSSELNTIC